MKRWDRFCEIRELSRPHFYEMSEVLVLTSTRSHSPAGRTRNEAGALSACPLCFHARSQISLNRRSKWMWIRYHQLDLQSGRNHA
jgi:hypothetical protein